MDEPIVRQARRLPSLPVIALLLFFQISIIGFILHLHIILTDYEWSPAWDKRNDFVFWCADLFPLVLIPNTYHRSMVVIDVVFAIILVLSVGETLLLFSNTLSPFNYLVFQCIKCALLILGYLVSLIGGTFRSTIVLFLLYVTRPVHGNPSNGIFTFCFPHTDMNKMPLPRCPDLRLCISWYGPH